ncbi:MAG: DnaB-like helicase C-terminal domain-containing protein [Oscillospiraceae bacterium]
MSLYSLEMLADEVAERAVAKTSGIFLDELIDGGITDAGKCRALSSSCSILSNLPIKIFDCPNVTPAMIRRDARATKGVKLIIVDFISLMGSDKKNPQNRNLELGAISRDLKNLAVELGVPIALFMLSLKTAFAEASGARSKRAMKDPLRQADTDSLNVLLPDSDKTTLEDTIPDERDEYEESEKRIFQEQLHKELERVLNEIPVEEAETVRHRYYDDLSIKATAEAMKIETAKARQLEGYGLRHLRAPKLSQPLRQFIEETTPYYLSVGPQRFISTGTSSTEQIVLIRERLAEEYNCKAI